MAKVGAQRAADLTGRSKSTIQRAMNGGKLSFDLDANGRRVIDVSELDRAFGLRQQPTNNVEDELKKASEMIEMERMKMRIKSLEDQLHTAHQQIDDLKEQRDQWQKQAAQVLITSQYSQKEAEGLREEIKTREERIEKRRRAKLEDRMKKLKAQNQNAAAQSNSGAGSQGFAFSKLWKKKTRRA